MYILVGLIDVENLTKACDRMKSLIEKHQSSLTKNICTEWFPLQHIVLNSAYDRTTIDFKSVAYARKFARQVEDLLSVAEDRMANTVVADRSPSSIGYTLRIPGWKKIVLLGLTFFQSNGLKPGTHSPKICSRVCETMPPYFLAGPQVSTTRT